MPWDVAKRHACHANRRGDRGVHWEPSAPPDAVIVTPATQSGGPCRQVPRLPRKVKADVATPATPKVVCGQVVCDVWVSYVVTSCVEKLYGSKLCVNKLCVEKLCVDKLCAEKLCVSKLLCVGTLFVCWWVMCGDKLCEDKLCVSKLWWQVVW